MDTIRYLLHTGDIHIGSMAGRSAEYRRIFKGLAEAARDRGCLPANTIVCVAGDVFHHKVRYSGEDVDDFYHFLATFAGFSIIIIPGNHDSNLADAAVAPRDRADLLSPLLGNKYPDVYYLRDSGHYEIRGVRFYHHSVYDQSTKEQIIDTAAANITGRVFLYHGMVDGAKFNSYVQRGSKISQDILEVAHIAVLGDIHAHQFITSNAAYCGSLIQQDLLEQAEKGAILWDLRGRRGEFIPVHNTCGFMRLDVRGKSPEEIEQAITAAAVPDRLLKVSLITDAADDEQCTAQKDMVLRKFGRLDVVNHYAALQLNPRENVREALQDLLQKKGANEGQIETILEKYLAGMTQYECKRWRLVRMEWDNLFKYGPGNSLNFEPLTGEISGVVAPNMTGKSSVIDILVFALFGEHLRADRINIIHHGAKTGRVRVDFVVNDVAYYVERMDDKNRNTKLIIMRYDGGPEGTGQWVSCGGSGIESTYKKMRTLVGTLPQFISTSLYYGRYDGISTMGRADRLRVLSELLGLTDNEDMVKRVKLEYRAIKQQLAALTRPRTATPDDDLAAARGAHDTLLSAHTTAEMEHARVSQRRAEVLRKVSAMRNPVELAEQIMAAETRCGDLRARRTAAGEVPYAPRADAVTLRPGETPDGLKSAAMALGVGFSPTGAGQVVLNAADITAETVRREARCAALRAQAEGLGLDTTSVENLADKLCAARAAMALDDEELSAVPVVDGAAISARLAAVDRELATLHPAHVNDALELSLQGQITARKSRSELRYAADCECCANNMRALELDLALLEGRYAEAQAANAEARARNADTADRRRELQAEREKLAAEYDTIGRRSAIMASRAAWEEECRKLEEQQNNAALLVDLATAEDDVRAARAALAAATRYGEIRAYAAYMRYERYETVCRELAAAEHTLAELCAIRAASGEYDALHCELRGLARDERTAKDRIVALGRELGLAEAAKNAAEHEARIAAEYAEKSQPLEEAGAVHKLFIDAIGNSGLKLAIIGRNISKLESILNDMMQYTVGFGVKFEMMDNGVDIYIVGGIGGTAGTAGNTPQRLPAAMGSGYQQFIVNILLRAALVKTLPTCAELLLIDEGFGSVDSNNMARLGDIFGSLREMIRCTFVISHVDYVSSLLTKKLFITVGTDGASRLSDGPIGPAPPKMKAITARKSPPLAQVTCECGATVSTRTITAHRRTLRHQKIMEAKAADVANAAGAALQ